MRRSNWLDGLRASLAHSSKPRARSTKKRRRIATRRPRFEPLEDRALLATLTVTSPLDNNTPGDGLVTLREAIIAANANTTTDLGQTGSGADTIEFAPSITGTIALSFGELKVTEGLTIDGPGRDALTIDAQQNSRIFTFRDGTGDFTITGLTLTGGRTTADYPSLGAGGAIFSFAGMTTINDCKVIANSTSGVDAWGGAVLAYFLTASNTDFIDNSTTGDGADGGALHVQYVATLNNCAFRGNKTTGTDAMGTLGTASGGAFHAGTARLANCTVIGNSTNNTGGGFFAVYSAALTNVVISDNKGDGFSITGHRTVRSTATLVNSTVSGNSGRGFGAYTVSLTDSVVSGNTGGGFGATTAVVANSRIVDNGWVGISASNTATVTNTTVSNNSGGGIVVGNRLHTAESFTLNSSTVTGNRRTESGGGIYAHAAQVALNSSTIDNNVSMATGGGIFIRGNLTLNSSTVSGNTATTTGGGIDAQQSPNGALVINHSTLTDNHVSSGAGGGLSKDQGPITISNSIIAGNTAGGGGPDLRHGSGTLTVHYSLIGDNAGTPLVEAQVPDANGNLIGSTIDPKLGPLTDNGGPTRTHALFPSSPAIDRIPYNPAPAPVLDYQLNGSLVDSLGGPSLIALGGSVTTSGHRFDRNQGLNLTSALTNPAQYSLELMFRWDELSGGWQKIIDFHNLTSNVGVYTAGGGLHFVNGPFTPAL